MDYVFRRPKPLGVPRPKRISTPAGQRLSTIVEGAPSEASRNSHRLSNMSTAQRTHIGMPPTHDAEKQPPEYAPVWEGRVPGSTVLGGGLDGDDDDNLPRRKASRGGWKRLAAIVGVMLAIVIALAVGLGVGLTRHKSGDGADQAGAPTPDAPTPFPIGSWSMTTALTNTSTACTSVSATWECPPYSTYAQSPSASRLIYDFDISARDPYKPSNDSLLVSTTNNVFLLVFSNVTLTLADAGLESEHYTFQLTQQKKVNPTQPIGQSSGRETCFYNQTLITGSLYTRRAPSYGPGAPSNGSMSMAALDSPASNMRMAWPYAVQVDVTQPGGEAVPDCYPMADSQVTGPRITDGLTAQPASSTCACNYANYDL